jgi:hypothetical protein
MNDGSSQRQQTLISLGALLAIAMLMRIPAILFSNGFEYYDEQFQYIDPAWHLATGAHWHIPPDYVHEIRSWVYPGILAGMFKILLWLGLEDPLDIMVGVRFLHALISLLPVYALWKYMQWRQLPPKRWFMLFATCNFLVIFAGVRPGGPAFAAGLSVAAVLFFEGPKLWPLLSGALLGLAFACRFQDAVFGPVLFLAAVFTKRYSALLWLCVGAAALILVQGIVDYETYGSFLRSPFAYYDYNILQGKAAEAGSEPFYYYIVVVVGALIAVPPFLQVTWRVLSAGARVMPVVLAAALVYLIMHSAPDRKAVRFVVPALILLWTAFGWRLFDREKEEDETASDGGWERYGHRGIFIAAHVLALVFFSLYFWNRGPIEAALELRQETPIHELWMVDGSDVSIGGHFYLNQRELQFQELDRQDLPARLQEINWSKREHPLYLMVGPDESKNGLVLSEIESTNFQVEELGAFGDWPEMRRRNRRWVYKVSAR